MIHALKEHILVQETMLLDELFLKKIQQSITVIVNSLRNGGKIHFCGNGGSAADAQHLAAELSGRFYFDRPPLNAEALHCNSSFLTAVGNDYGFDNVYARMIEACAHAGDVLIAISTSGNSTNVINAAKQAKSMNVQIISMTGLSGGSLKSLSDILINVPSSITPRIQEAHILVGHIICEQVEKQLFPHEK